MRLVATGHEDVRGPLGLAQRTSDPHGEHRVRKRDEPRGWHGPVVVPFRIGWLEAVQDGVGLVRPSKPP